MNLDQLTASFRATTDGRFLGDFSNVPLERSAWSEQHGGGAETRFGCAFYRPAQGFLYTCGSASTSGDGTWTGSSSVNVWMSAGDVTYHSEGWDQTWLDAGYDYWSWNYDTRETYGSQVRIGEVLALDLAVSDGTTTLEAHPTIIMNSVGDQYTSSYCYPTWDGDMCVDYEYRTSGKVGEAWHMMGWW